LPCEPTEQPDFKMALMYGNIPTHSTPVEKWLSALPEDDDIVPWIWEFSFLYKPGGFDLDDVRREEKKDLGVS
jgi:hypothetical protein